ncbi:type II toxin-antitoxin system RelE/ParE family toxin [Archangium lansingense]|uniref:type II toxin-antitoxin system RelE/ParE family toxin n=1 Tax=Archangium lansingense TaxID=2995310 RepID=UPI003B7B1E60
MGRRYAVEWAEVARTDLDELLDYIEQDEPGVALAVLERLEQAAKRLESMPLRGRVVPELAQRNIRLYRELIVRPWRIIYRVGDGPGTGARGSGWEKGPRGTAALPVASPEVEPGRLRLCRYGSPEVPVFPPLAV